MSKLKIIITGSEGFIGKHLCKALKKLGYEIVGIDIKNENFIRKEDI